MSATDKETADKIVNSSVQFLKQLAIADSDIVAALLTAIYEITKHSLEIDSAHLAAAMTKGAAIMRAPEPTTRN